MTKLNDKVHTSVIFPGYAGTTPPDMISEKEQIIAKMHLQLKDSPFAAFCVVVACEAIVFLVATSLHAGAFGVPQFAGRLAWSCRAYGLPGLNIPINIGLHGVMLALIVIGLVLLAFPVTRTDFLGNDHT